MLTLSPCASSHRVPGDIGRMIRLANSATVKQTSKLTAAIRPLTSRLCRSLVRLPGTCFSCGEKFEAVLRGKVQRRSLLLGYLPVDEFLHMRLVSGSICDLARSLSMSRPTAVDRSVCCGDVSRPSVRPELHIKTVDEKKLANNSASCVANLDDD